MHHEHAAKRMNTIVVQLKKFITISLVEKNFKLFLQQTKLLYFFKERQNTLSTMVKQIEDIWVDLHQELKKFIFNKTKDMAISEDILQDVFLKIQLNIHTLSDCSKLTSWVYQITRNTVADHYRKTNFEFQIDSLDFAEQENEESLYLSLSNCINQKINKLSEKYKQAILLTYFNNISQISFAEELKISYSATKTRVQRGREKLKELLVDCENVVTDKKGNLVAYQNSEK